jgi:hypothetical protein
MLFICGERLYSATDAYQFISHHSICSSALTAFAFFAALACNLYLGLQLCFFHRFSLCL